MRKVNSILLIDDNPGDNFLHSYIIRETGVCSNIQVTENGREAIEYLEASLVQENEGYDKPDLIFLDINMPKMDGFEFLNECEKLNQNLLSDSVLFFLTSSNDPDEKRRALKNKSVKGYLNKPLDESILDEITENHFLCNAKVNGSKTNP